MNTMKSVFSKIAEDKTELAKHEVQLNLIGDFEKLTDSFFVSGGKFEKAVQKVEASIKDMNAEYVEHVKVLSTIDSEYQKIRKAAMELGLNLPKEIENNYKKVLAVAKNDLNTKKKYTF